MRCSAISPQRVSRLRLETAMFSSIDHSAKMPSTRAVAGDERDLAVDGHSPAPRWVPANTERRTCRCPLPSSPASPTISPRPTSRLTPRSSPRAGRAAAPAPSLARACRRARQRGVHVPAAQELDQFGVRRSRWSLPVQATRPLRITMMRSATLEGLAQAVGDEDERDAFAAPLPHVGAQLLGLARAERGRRLVENQQLRRRMARRPGDLHHLLLGQRQRADLGARVDRVAREHSSSAALANSHRARLPADAANDVRQLDRKILEHPQIRAERQLLVDEAQPELHRRPRRMVRPEAPPRSSISPPSAAIRPPTIFIKVLLPAPLPPIRPTISAASTAKSTCCTALRGAERLVDAVITRRRDGLPPSGARSRVRRRTSSDRCSPCSADHVS